MVDSPLNCSNAARLVPILVAGTHAAHPIGGRSHMVAAARTVHRHARRARVALALAASALLLLVPAVAMAADYNPLLVISDEQWRDVNSMSAGEIQSFLNAPLPGEGPSVLATFTGPERGEHGGAVKSAAQIIWEACQAYNLNPKVILATLEKEQSLITQHWHVASPGNSHGTDYHLKYALGAGVYSGSADMHPGFGDQVWESARRFGTFPGSYAWKPGQAKYVHSYPDSAAAGGADVHIWITPLNGPTWALYNYTPYYPQKSFWNYYVKFFGDPLAPPRFRPVYRIYNKRTGTTLWTTSLGERNSLLKYWGKRGVNEGVAFTIDASSTANADVVWRIYNKRTRKYFYTASVAARDQMLRKTKGTVLDGGAFLASAAANGTPVYQLYARGTRTYFYTADPGERLHLMKRHRYRDNGVAFYLAPYVAPPVPSTPTSPTPPVTATAP